MTNTYHQICLRLVFAVKYRAAVLDKAWRQKVKGVIGSLINEAGCNTIIVNGMEEHMHRSYRDEGEYNGSKGTGTYY